MRFLLSKGIPSIGVMSKPTLLTTRPQAMSLPGGAPTVLTVCLPGSPCSSVRLQRRPEQKPSLLAVISVGAARKRSHTIRFDVVCRCSKLATILSMISKERFFGRFVASSFSLAALRDSATSSGSTIGMTSLLMSRSSLSSLLVNAACTRPRLPRTCTVCRPAFCHEPIRSMATSHISVCRSSSGLLTSSRATSNATLPLPTTTALLPMSAGNSSTTDWWSGWPLYHLTNAGAPITPPRSSPGMPSFLSPCAPVHSTTASYDRSSVSKDTFEPTSTLPKKRKRPASSATAVKSLMTFFTSG
mmetsp:Transcript_66165/g.158261  ORF Transcript_66165/g.158261 Transcript_66165/m.158261 type:complete len:301 (-) Transcript_66165:282-1184(-)